MRINVRHLCLALVPISVFAYLARDDFWDTHYCARCGLLRDTRARTFFGLMGRPQIAYSETEFHRLYQWVFGGSCQHQWQAYSGRHSCPPDYVRLPCALRPSWGEALYGLVRLNDRGKAHAVLDAFDLRDDLEFMATLTEAFADLKNVTDGASEEVWWAKHGHLFVNARTRQRLTGRTGPGSRRTAR